MSVTSDSFSVGQTGATGSASDAIMLRATGGRRFLMRGAQRLLGASLSMAALCLWLLPVGDGGTAELLCKLMFTLILGFAGATAWQAGSPAPAPELEIDIVRREVRLIRWYGETKSLVTRRRFRDLSHAEFDGCDVRLWDEDYELLAELTLPNADSVEILRRALEDSRKPLAMAA